MRQYDDLSGNSGASGYEFTEDGILVEFNHKDVYLYDYTKPGKEHVEKMRQLALNGQGLTTYINQYIRGNYRRKIDQSELELS